MEELNTIIFRKQTLEKGYFMWKMFRKERKSLLLTRFPLAVLCSTWFTSNFLALVQTSLLQRHVHRCRLEGGKSIELLLFFFTHSRHTLAGYVCFAQTKRFKLKSGSYVCLTLSCWTVCQNLDYLKASLFFSRTGIKFVSSFTILIHKNTYLKAV